MTEIIPIGAPAAHLVDPAGDLLDAELVAMAAARSWSKAKNTLRAYRADWRGFVAYCALVKRQPFPARPEHIEAYATFLAAPDGSSPLINAWRERAGHKDRAGRAVARLAPPYPPASVDRAIAGIRYIHTLLATNHGLTVDPFADIGLSEALRGIRRRDAAGEGRPRGARAKHHEAKAAIDLDLLPEIVRAMDLSTLSGLRDRAILCVGVAGGLRVGELAGLTWQQLKRNPDGLLLTFSKSKANQDGRKAGDSIVLPRTGNEICPIAALEGWRAAAALPRRGRVWTRIYATKDSGGEAIGEKAILDESGLAAGLTPRTVDRIVRARLIQAQDAAPASAPIREVDPRDIGPHSLRHGLATALAESETGLEIIQRTLRHATPATTMRYIHTRSKRQAAAVRDVLQKSIKDT